MHFCFWNFIDEDVYAEYFRTIKDLEDAIVSELGQPHSQTVDCITDQGTIRLPAVTLHKGAQTGLFILSAADGQPRVGMADDMVNLLCHFIGNERYFIFGNVMPNIKIIK